MPRCYRYAFWAGAAITAKKSTDPKKTKIVLAIAFILIAFFLLNSFLSDLFSLFYTHFLARELIKLILINLFRFLSFIAFAAVAISLLVQKNAKNKIPFICVTVGGAAGILVSLTETINYFYLMIDLYIPNKYIFFIIERPIVISGHFLLNAALLLLGFFVVKNLYKSDAPEVTSAANPHPNYNNN